MGYALQPMLRIRLMREDRAQKALAVARRARDAAKRTLEEKRAARQAFEQTKEERRDKIYDAVIGRVLDMSDFDDARSAVSRIDEEGVLLDEAEVRAKDFLVKKEEEAEGARVVFVGAMKDRTKIDEHRKIWMEEDRREQEMRADLELEEFTGKKVAE